jgi:hypothetical protein
MNIEDEISKKGFDAEKIAGQVINEPDCIAGLIDGIKAAKGTLRYGYEKVLRLVSERKPELIYPYFDVYTELLDSDNSFIKWGTILTIANLVEVDKEKKFEKIFEHYYCPITGPVMVTAANIIGSSEKIVSARPQLTARITDEILKVEKAKYYMHGTLSPECRNVAMGHAIDTFFTIFDKIENKDAVIKFVRKGLDNSRKSVVKKAEKFLKRHKI